MKQTTPPMSPDKTLFFLEHPERFNVATLQSNEIEWRDGLQPPVKIPKIENRIRLIQDENGLDTKVLLATGRETEETEEKTVLLGRTFETMLRGMMVISNVYHDYFDTSGDLICDPLNPEDEAEPENEELTDK